MKNVFAVARREFRSAFDLPIAYVFIAAFLILAALGGLLGFFDRGVSDLRDYFGGLRYAFVLFAPAVSMRLWAEERRSRTFELLFTLPVRPWEAVLGKYLGALGLVAVALALGAVLPITLSRWASFDTGAIVAGYLGVLLLASAEMALGLLVSALTDNQIVAFVGAAVASFLLLIAGEPALLSEAERVSVSEGFAPLRAAFLAFLSRVGTGEHQDGLAKGVVDTGDVVYFVAITAFFLLANVVAVERRRARLEPILVVVLGLAAFFLVEDVAMRRSARFDLTSRGTFSLHPGTKAALSGVEARLTLRCYLSRDLPAAEEREKRALLDLLHEVEAQGGKNVRLEVMDPKGDEKLVEQAKREGVMSITRQLVSTESAETKVIWGGLSILYAGKPPMAIPYALYKPNLEYDLAVVIRKLVQKDSLRIAWIEPTPQKDAYKGIREELSRSYAIEPFDLKNKPEISIKEYRIAVVVLDPKAPAALTERQLYELDQFLMRGGSLVVLMKPMSIDQHTFKASPVDWGIVDKTLEKWGLSVPPKLVLALSPHMRRWTLPSPSRQGYVQTDKYAFCLEPDSMSNQGSPVAGQVGRCFFPFAGEVVPTPNHPAATVTPLVRTARDSWTAGGVVDLDPVMLRVPRDPRERQPRVIAAALTGELTSAFDAPVPPAKPGKDPLAERVASTKTGRLILFGDSEFIRDVTQQAYPEAFGGSQTVFLNTIDWASEDATLATMRSRATVEPVRAENQDSARAVAWGVNLLGMPLVVGLLGIARFLLRRRAGRRAATLSRKGAAE
jgi:ABC-2 type transport system permease protein